MRNVSLTLVLLVACRSENGLHKRAPAFDGASAPIPIVASSPTMPTTRAVPLHSDVVSGPLTATFERFVHRDGPLGINETIPEGAESQVQGLVVLLENHGTRTAGCYAYEVVYLDAANARVPVQTNHALVDHDESSVCGVAFFVAPGERKEVRFMPNYGPIPATAVSAEVRFLRVCDDERPRGGFRVGECWWVK